MLSQLWRGFPEPWNRPMARNGASTRGACALLRPLWRRRATSGAVTSRHFTRMLFARVEVPGGAAGAKGAPVRGGDRSEKREAGHGRDRRL